jgi:hypothetical protein
LRASLSSTRSMRGISSDAERMPISTFSRNGFAACF